MTAIRIITGEYGLVVSALRGTGTWRSTRAKSWAGRAMAGHSTDGAEVRVDASTRRPGGLGRRRQRCHGEAPGVPTSVGQPSCERNQEECSREERLQVPALCGADSDYDRRA